MSERGERRIRRAIATATARVAGLFADDRLRAALGIAATRFATVALSLLFAIVATRLVGTTDFGTYSTMMAIAGLASVLVGAGPAQLLEREIAAARGSGSAERVAALLQAIVVLAILLVIVLAASSVLAPSPWPSLAWLAAISVAAGIPGAILSGHERVEFVALASGLFRSAAALSFVAVFWALGSISVRSLIDAQALAVIATFLILSFASFGLRETPLRRAWALAGRPPKLEPEHAALARAAVHIALINTLHNAVQQAEILWLAALASPEDVAHFFAATRAANAVSFFYASLLALTRPTIIRLHAGGEHARRDKEVLRTTRLSLALTAAAAIGAGFLAEPYLRAFGDDFMSAWGPMLMLLAGWVVLAALGPVTTVLMMAGREFEIWTGIAFGLAIGGVAAYVSIPPFGLFGAAVSYNLTIIGTQLILLPIVRRELGYLPIAGLRL